MHVDIDTAQGDDDKDTMMVVAVVKTMFEEYFVCVKKVFVRERDGGMFKIYIYIDR